MLFDKNKLRLPDSEDALEGRKTPMPGSRTALRQRPRPHRATVPRWARAGAVRHGLLLGSGAQVLAAPGVYTHRRRLRRRPHAEPDLRRGVLRADGPQRGRARRLRSGDGRVTRSCCKLFWESHDPTQGMRQGNDVGTQYRSGIYTYDDAQRARRRGGRATPTRRRWRRRLRRDHDRDRWRRRTSTTPRTTTSSTWPRTRAAIAVWAAPGSLPGRHRGPGLNPGREKETGGEPEKPENRSDRGDRRDRRDRRGPASPSRRFRGGPRAGRGVSRPPAARARPVTAPFAPRAGSARTPRFARQTRART